MNQTIEQALMQAGASFASRETEQAIIKTLLTSRVKTNLLTAISYTDFTAPELGRIFRACQAVSAKGRDVDYVTVTEMLSRDKVAGDMLIGALNECINNSLGSAVYADSYIEILKALSTRRAAVRLTEQAFNRLADPAEDTQAVIDAFRTELIALEQSRQDWTPLPDVINSAYDYIERKSRGEIVGITSGVPDVDRLTGGFFPGELTIIGARPAVGKSAFALNIAYEAARKGFKVGILSREMSDTQLGSRMLARASQVDGMKLRKGELTEDDWFQVAQGVEELSDMNIDFLFGVSTVEELRTLTQRKVENHALDMLIVDYLQLMDTTQRIREEHLRVGHISKALKRMSVDFNIPVIALAQVNRDTDGQMPQLKSLKDSGSIEQDADGVLFLHRVTSPDDRALNPLDKQYIQGWVDTGYDYICIGIAKQRQGSIGQCEVLFDKAHMRYLSIDRSRP